MPKASHHCQNNIAGEPGCRVQILHQGIQACLIQIARFDEQIQESSQGFRQQAIVMGESCNSVHSWLDAGGSAFGRQFGGYKV